MSCINLTTRLSAQRGQDQTELVFTAKGYLVLWTKVFSYSSGGFSSKVNKLQLHYRHINHECYPGITWDKQPWQTGVLHGCWTMLVCRTDLPFFTFFCSLMVSDDFFLMSALAFLYSKKRTRRQCGRACLSICLCVCVERCGVPLAWSLSSWLATFFHSSIFNSSGVIRLSERALRKYIYIYIKVLHKQKGLTNVHEPNNENTHL